MDNNFLAKVAISRAEQLIYENTLTNNAVSITISTDNGGQSFNLSKARLLLYIPANTIANNTVVMLSGTLNGLPGSIYYSTSIGVGDYFNAGSVRNVHNLTELKFNVVGTSILCDGNTIARGYAADGVAYTGTVAFIQGGTIESVAITAITKLLLFNMTFPVGTKIKLLGVRA